MGGSGKKEAALGKENTKHQGQEMEHSSGRKGLGRVAKILVGRFQPTAN